MWRKGIGRESKKIDKGKISRDMFWNPSSWLSKEGAPSLEERGNLHPNAEEKLRQI